MKGPLHEFLRIEYHLMQAIFLSSFSFLRSKDIYFWCDFDLTYDLKLQKKCES